MPTVFWAAVLLAVACGGSAPGAGQKRPVPEGEVEETATATESETEAATETDARGSRTEPETEAESETESEGGVRESRTESVGRPILEAHNRFRAKHCAPPLSWSRELERAAKAWAKKLERRGCVLEHSRSRYGENLAGGSAGALGPREVAAMWYGEVRDYRFDRGGFSFETGHFTQLVWADSRELGCATARCGGIELWVCNYAPAGNVHGLFQKNVKPTSCSR